MSRWTRWFLRLLGAAAIVAVSVFGTLTYQFLHPYKIVPLTDHLGGEWSAVSKEFDRRVKVRFPVGSSEDAMARELRSEGFSRDDWAYANAKNQEAQAVKEENAFPCDMSAHIYWRADGSGRLTSIRGQYGEDGCL